MNNFYIKKLTLRNFKGYEYIEIPLEKGVNILYGTNGTGKTSILEALTVAVGSFFMKFSNVEKRLIKNSDIRLKRLNDDRYPTYQFPVEVEGEGVWSSDGIIHWKRSLNSIASTTTNILAREMENISGQMFEYMQTGENQTLPLIAYFSTGRLFEERKYFEKKPDGKAIGYYNALNATNIRKHIQSWFADAEFEQYQKRQTDPAFTDIALKLIKQLILQCFDGNWKDIYYFEPKSNKKTPLDKGLFIVKNDGSIISERALSDGQRNFMWLIVELGWRACMLNPHLGETVFEEVQGVVLVDEIDLHLHPKWQQTIVGILAKSFPQLQFVLSTHSPIVISSANAHILKLEEHKIVPQPKLYGMKAADIMRQFMGTSERLPEITDLVQQYFELINREEYANDAALEIRKKLELIIPSHDTLFTEADALIDFLKL